MQLAQDFTIIDNIYLDRRKYDYFINLTNHFLYQRNVYDLNSLQLISLCRMISLKGQNCIMTIKEYDENVHPGSNPGHFLNSFIKNKYLNKEQNSTDKRSFILAINDKSREIVNSYCEFLKENANNLSRDFNWKEEKNAHESL